MSLTSIHTKSGQSLPARPAGGIVEEIFRTDFDFEKTALELFRYQAKENVVYKNYIEQLKIDPVK